MAPFAGFIGGSYGGRESDAVGERSINWFPERVETPNVGKGSEWILLGRPGKQTFIDLGTGAPIQSMLEINGRLFAISNQNFYEIHWSGTAASFFMFATLAPGRVQMVASQTQVLIIAGINDGYVFDLTTNGITHVWNAESAADFPHGATKLAISDGYFLALIGGTQNVAFSALNDGRTWSALDFANAQGEPGSIVSIICDHRQLWILSATHSEVYYDSGDADTPWTRLNGAMMEQGCGAQDSVVKCDNTLFWVGANPNGGGVAWRAAGYTPQRISTHAIESVWQSYPTIANATAYCYQEEGHTFYRLDFPSANSGHGATWVYDIASGMWHERTYYNWATSTDYADRAQTHAYVFGMHLVGDSTTGIIYQQAMDYATDNGDLIRRVRQTPSVSNGGRFSFFAELRLLMTVGVGLDGGLYPGTDPQILLQVSNDGGHTWFDHSSVSLGRLGQYTTLVRWNQLGTSRNRSFAIVVSDPVKCCLFAADLDVADA